jgi:hypothetical protein
MTGRSARLLAGGLVLLAASAGVYFVFPRPVPVPVADEGPAGPAWFADVTAEVGLDFVHDAGPVGHFFMPQIMGAGAALFDLDGDGRLDLYLLQSGGPDSRSTNRLYRQGPDGRFTDISQGSGLDVAGYCTGVAVGDVNNDGRPDVLVTQYGGLKLFLNNGNSTFTDAGPGSGLDSVLWGTSASFVDYDRDGWLDLVAVNYVLYDPSVLCHDRQGRRDCCNPRQFPGSVTRLYRNRGPQASTVEAGRSVGRFEDVTEKAGLSRQAGPGLGIACADFTGDGWPDLFVANDGAPNHLWVNQRNGTFQEEAVARGLAFDGMGRAPANMGVALGDVDGNGLFDLFVTHLTSETHTLWCQEPRGFFRDRTVPAGLAPPGSRGTGFGTVLADFNHDGAPDVVAVNGRVARGQPVAEEALGPFWSQYGERNQLFAGTGNGTFQDVSPRDRALCGVPGVYRGLACGDIDGDGALDLVVTELAGRARLLRNVAPDRGHSLLVRALDPALQRDAYGAEVAVRAGGRRWVRWINPGYSYLCSNDSRAHVGLGPVDRVDAIDVLWPDGTRETFPGGPASPRSELVVRKGTGRPVKD